MHWKLCGMAHHGLIGDNVLAFTWRV